MCQLYTAPNTPLPTQQTYHHHRNHDHDYYYDQGHEIILMAKYIHTSSVQHQSHHYRQWSNYIDIDMKAIS